MTKVILDFQSLGDTEEIGIHLQHLVDCAKDITGFVFLGTCKDGSGVQLLCSINSMEIAALFERTEEAHPEIKMLRMIQGFMGGGMRGRRGMSGI